jgi:cobaltochelatase CobN
MRHEGIVESQIFYLLGTRPVWDGRDKVVGVEVIPAAELGRPRIDIIIASAAEGMFNNVTVLMDQAVQKVKALQETENFVRDHYLATKAALIDLGYSDDDADRRAGVRIFDEPPGTYSLNTSKIAAASGSWDSEIGMVNDYINKMGHGFGNGFWGEPMQDVFKLALAGVDKVVHSSSTMLYGALDNDDFFMYMGGLAAAIKTVDGDAPELLVTNTRNPSQPEMSSIDKFIGMEFNTRYINPNWIRGMQAEGYAGARNMVEFVEYMWGWDATVSETIDDNMWQQSFAVYVQDKYELGMEEFFDDNSPYAFQDLSVRMLETIRKQYWDADQETLTELLEAYVGSVNKHGINCTQVSCGNPRLMEYVLLEGENNGLSGLDLSGFRQAVETAIQASIETLARAAENFANSNDARIAELYETAATLEGFAMEPIEQPRAPQIDLSVSENDTFAYLFQGLVLLLLLVWWSRRRMNRVTAV